jgi:hypothetical protein
MKGSALHRYEYNLLNDRTAGQRKWESFRRMDIAERFELPTSCQSCFRVSSVVTDIFLSVTCKAAALLASTTIR